MKTTLPLFAALLFTQLSHTAEPTEKHLLYMASPDGSQGGGSGTGVLVFDIDDGHKFVRRIDVPIFKEGIRGFCPNAATHRAYYSTTNHTLGCLDLETDKVVWEKKYPTGCDRAAVTPDGKKLYVPSGWWVGEGASEWFVVDAATGEVTKHIPVNSRAHNTVMGLDGKSVLCGSETRLTVVRTSDDTVLKVIEPVGEAGVFPMTVNSAGTWAFVCLGKTVGVDVVDLAGGQVRFRLPVSGNIRHRTHGAALTPDEKELWVSDQDGKRLYIFDAVQVLAEARKPVSGDGSGVPPKETGHVDLSIGGHGWITFSLDGRYAWCHTPDVIDAKTRQIVATLKDENGKTVCGSKFFEAVFRDGKVTAVSDQFGVGRATLPK